MRPVGRPPFSTARQPASAEFRPAVWSELQETLRLARAVEQSAVPEAHCPPGPGEASSALGDGTVQPVHHSLRPAVASAMAERRTTAASMEREGTDPGEP